MRENLVVTAMLNFLLEDIESHPERLQPLPAGLAEKMAALTQGMTFDPDEEIEGDVDL